MNKNIIILNGAPRKNGNTAKLIKSFSEGAESAGHNINEFYLNEMQIKDYLGCRQVTNNFDNLCIQKDDMKEIYKDFRNSDIDVFASPIYFWTISGVLKTAVDRLFAEYEIYGFDGVYKESVLLMTAGSFDYSQALTWYHGFQRYSGWKNLGEVLGIENIEEAKKLGASLC